MDLGKVEMVIYGGGSRMGRDRGGEDTGLGRVGSKSQGGKSRMRKAVGKEKPRDQFSYDGGGKRET